MMTGLCLEASFLDVEISKNLAQMGVQQSLEYSVNRQQRNGFVRCGG